MKATPHTEKQLARNNMFRCLSLLSLTRCFFYRVLMSVLMTAGLLLIVTEVHAAQISFDEFPEGTVITDQYQGLGVVFSGSPASPVAQKLPPDLQDFASNYTQYIGSDESFTVTFFKPEDGTPVEAENISFWALINFRFGSLLYTFYDVQGNVIHQEEWNNDPFGFNHDNIPRKFHKFVATTPYLAAEYWIDNLRFQFACNGTDADGDGHYTPESCRAPNDDCDDTDPAIPGPEICMDGTDNDCDGRTDCVDSECLTGLNCYPPECSSSAGAPSSYVGE